MFSVPEGQGRPASMSVTATSETRMLEEENIFMGLVSLSLP